MFAPFRTRLLVATKNQDGEINAQPDEDGAHSDGHHVELLKDEEPNSERHEAAKQKGKAHSNQREPAMETGKENSTHKQHRTNESNDDVMPHAARNLRDISRAA